LRPAGLERNPAEAFQQPDRLRDARRHWMDIELDYFLRSAAADIAEVG
jgi:hypothetical protein